MNTHTIPPDCASNANRFAENANKCAENANRFAENANKCAENLNGQCQNSSCDRVKYSETYIEGTAFYEQLDLAISRVITGISVKSRLINYHKAVSMIRTAREKGHEGSIKSCIERFEQISKNIPIFIAIISLYVLL